MASSPSFSDFPEDMQLNVLSFLSPAEVSAFACTSRRFAALCSASASDSPVWLAMCDRGWGSKTLIRSWASGGAASRFPYACFYRALDRWETLIGFWLRIGHGTGGTPSLVFFQSGPSTLPDPTSPPRPSPAPMESSRPTAIPSSSSIRDADSSRWANCRRLRIPIWCPLLLALWAATIWWQTTTGASMLRLAVSIRGFRMRRRISVST